MITLSPLLIFYLLLLGLATGLDLLIEGLNYRHVKKHGHSVPPAFKGWIAPERLEESSRYTAENIGFSIIKTFSGKIVFLAVLLSGILPDLVEFLKPHDPLLDGLIFFAVLGIISTVFSACFDYYHCFVLEEKYGFNTRTPKIWLVDLMKSIFLMTMIGSLLISAALLIIQFAPETWWLWIWLFFTGFQLLMVILFPTVIAPLFNKFTPVEDIELNYKIAKIAEHEGIQISGIYQMDASKRTRHTNAYLSGLGKAKRIVLFDSLIQAHDHDEILAILAHEIGHFKKKHIIKNFLIHTLGALVLLFLSSKLLNWQVMYQSFGFSSAVAYVGLFLVGILWEPVGIIFSPLFNYISRRFEQDADRSGIEIMATAKPLIRALKKMAKDNLANLHPHPLYVCFNYSHPPILLRIQRLEVLEAAYFSHHV